MKPEIIKPLGGFMPEQIIVWTPDQGKPDHHVYLKKESAWEDRKKTAGRWNIYYRMV